MNKGPSEAPAGRRIKVLLADDHAIMREGLRALLAAEGDFEVVGEAGTGPEAVRRAIELKPDVVVMDIKLPDMNGLHATHRILEQDDEIRVVVLSMSGDEEIIAQAIEAGAKGYLVKETVARDLLSAIREVHRGNAYFSPEVANVVLELQKRSASGERPHTLTLREREVLQLIAEGKSSRKMAEQLCVSTKTVEKYRQQVMDKLGIHDAIGLTRYAVTKGLVK